jgi:hypothetical protein
MDLFSPLTASTVWWPEFLGTDPDVLYSILELPDILSNDGSVTGATQPREDNVEILERRNSGAGL